MKDAAAKTAVVYSGGSSVVEGLRTALGGDGIEVKVVSTRDEVFAAPPRVLVIDLHGFPDPWNDVRRFGTDPRLGGTAIFVYADSVGNGPPDDRPMRLRRFAFLVAGALRAPAAGA